MEPEYFYREALRWNFGFENPNKAAVVFACLLPLGWMAWQLSWRLKHWRITALAVSALFVLAASFCLFKTYSRGGAVAGGVALAYLMIHRGIGRMPMLRVLSSVGLLAAILGMFVFLGVGARSLQVSEDASVGNRLVLWRSALQMAVENPRGFGGGNSGEAYMQWYQPLEMTAGYRTMVNSYLTFLVEQGWLVFSLALLAFLFLWFWTAPRSDSSGLGYREFSAGLRAAVLAFAVSGIFSTVMEEPVLWMIPGGCGIALAFLAARNSRALSLPRIIWAAGSSAIVVAALYGSGLVWSSQDPLHRKFRHTASSEAMVELAPKENRSSADPWLIIPDSAVMGKIHGKLIRRLSLETGKALLVSATMPAYPQTTRAILAGRAIEEIPNFEGSALVLLNPATTESNLAGSVFSLKAQKLILLPDLDEDGRTAFWEKLAENAVGKDLRVARIEGVGIQVDWGWDKVIESIKDL